MCKLPSFCSIYDNKEKDNNYIAVVKDNHAPGLLADGRQGMIHFGGHCHWFQLIPKRIFAEHEVGKMLRQTSRLKNFNLGGRENNNVLNVTATFKYKPKTKQVCKA